MNPAILYSVLWEKPTPSVFQRRFNFTYKETENKWQAKGAEQMERRNSLLWNLPHLTSAGVDGLLKSLEHPQYMEFLFFPQPFLLTKRIGFDHTHFPSAGSPFIC